MTIVATDKYTKQAQLDELNVQTANLMGFKKVHWFMGKLCVQIEGDVPNFNVQWSPTTNANDALQIMKKFRFIMKPSAIDGWLVYSEHTESYDSDPLIAICKSLIAHARLG